MPVPEGARLVTCPSCQQRLFVQGDRGVRRWQLRRVVTRDQAQQTVTGFFNGMNKAGDLKRKAEIKELFLVYLPFWRVMASVAGWRLGRVRRDKDSTKPVEVEVLEEMQWNDAAVDVSEFGVNRVPIAGKNFEPFDQDRLSAEGMIFEATESSTDACRRSRRLFSASGAQQEEPVDHVSGKVPHAAPAALAGVLSLVGGALSVSQPQLSSGDRRRE